MFRSHHANLEIPLACGCTPQFPRAEDNLSSSLAKGTPFHRPTRLAVGLGLEKSCDRNQQKLLIPKAKPPAQEPRSTWSLCSSLGPPFARHRSMMIMRFGSAKGKNANRLKPAREESPEGSWLQKFALIYWNGPEVSTASTVFHGCETSGICLNLPLNNSTEECAYTRRDGHCECTPECDSHGSL
jgi:hypothetical protein